MTEDRPETERPGLLGPLVIDRDDEADPGAAPLIGEDTPDGRAMQIAAAVASRRASPLMRAALWVFSAFFTFVLSVLAWEFVSGLITSYPLLGYIALVLTVAAVGMALILAGREWLAFLRLGRLDSLRLAADAARAANDVKAARAVADQVAALYSHRAETAAARVVLAARHGDVFDADGALDLAEQHLILPLDARARAEIEAAARQVATVTALVPLALADVAMALFANLRMIRRIAEIYGGRSGSFASIGLLRRVFTYLIATGAVALTDDMIGSVAGGGVLSKLSRRFGEGVVNGALTARVGIAAMELCRPLPFRVAERPGVSSLLSRALAGLFDRMPGRSGAGKTP